MIASVHLSAASHESAQRVAPQLQPASRSVSPRDNIPYQVQQTQLVAAMTLPTTASRLTRLHTCPQCKVTPTMREEQSS